MDNTLPSDASLLQKKKDSTPNEFAKFMQEKGKIFWWPAGKFYVITDFQMARKVLMSSDFSADRTSFFISRMPNLDLRLIKDFFGVISKMMVMNDAPEHTTRRKIAAIGVNDDLLDRYTPLIEKTVDSLIEKSAQKGFIEFVDDLAEPLPSTILADLFCIEEKDRKDFYKWSKNMTQFFGGASKYRNEDGEEVNHSAIQIRNYFSDLVKSRRENPKEDDFLSIILQHQEKFSLSNDEIVSQAVMMLVAGQVTTTDQLCNNMFAMLTETKALKQLRENLDLLPSALEEYKRLDPGVTFLFRVTKNATTIGEQPVKPEDVIFFANHAINRDPGVYENPEECIISRKKNPHFAYGYGPHYCLGARLARIQMVACFGNLLKRFPNLRLNPNKPAVRKHYSLAFSGFDTIHLSL